MWTKFKWYNPQSSSWENYGEGGAGPFRTYYDYTENTLMYDGLNLYRARRNFTSGATVNLSDWELVLAANAGYNYDYATNKPAINGIELTKTSTYASLGLATQNDLSDKLDKKPDGANDLIGSDGKLNNKYVPASILGGLTYGGSFDSSGIISASSYAPLVNGVRIDDLDTSEYPGYYFIANGAYEFGGNVYSVGDWAVSQGTESPNWIEIDNGNAVSSVNGRVGAVVLTKNDVGLGNVDDTSDTDKPISALQQAALDLKVDKVSGKGLSTEDFSTSEKSKLSGIEEGAQVNAVKSVNAKTGDVVLSPDDIGAVTVDGLEYLLERLRPWIPEDIRTEKGFLLCAENGQILTEESRISWR